MIYCRYLIAGKSQKKIAECNWMQQNHAIASSLEVACSYNIVFSRPVFTRRFFCSSVYYEIYTVWVLLHENSRPIDTLAVSGEKDL